MNRRFQSVLSAIAFLLVLFICSPAMAQASKRLILKDGSYQPASRWETKGDRVRYFSTERGEWEELPASMVDWSATENYEKERQAERSLGLKQAQEQDENSRESKSGLAATPTVAPGIQLPNSGGVLLLDNYNGQPQLAELAQNSGELNHQTGRNILRAAINPIATAKQSIELKGEHARIQSHTQQPVVFIDIDEAAEAESLALADRFRIVRLEPKRDSRIVGNLKIGLTGKISQQQSFIPATAEKIAGDWIKLTARTPLSPGEYAVVEMLNQKEMNLYVWDFGVNLSAPENPGAWKPSPRQTTSGGTEQRPELENRPR